MQAIKIKKQLISDTQLPELKSLIGKKVEILILVEDQYDKEPDLQKSFKRRPGSAKGKIKISDDFDEPLGDEIIEEFYK